VSFLQETDEICQLGDEISSLFTLVYASLAYEMTCRLYIEGNTRQLLKYLESSPALNKISLFTIDNFAKAYNTAISDRVSIEMTKPLHCFICSLSFAIARDYY